MAIVEYNYQWLTGNYENYWDGFFFFPENEAITYSDNLLGITPIYALVRLLSGGNVLTAFQYLMLACHILNYASCYWALYKISGNRYASATGAFIFAFSLSLNGIHNHPQFIFRFMVPLFFYYIYQYFLTTRIRLLIYAAAALVIQFYLGAYLGILLMAVGGFFTLSYLIIYRPGFSFFKTVTLHCIIVGIGALLCMLPQLYFYYKRVSVTGFYASYDYYMDTVPRISSYFKSFPGSIAWEGLVKTDVYSNSSWLHALFPGALVILAIAGGIYLAVKKDRVALLLILMLTLTLCFTIYYQGHTMYGFLMKVPGIKTVRVVSRIITVIIFPASWLVCLSIAKLYGRSGKFSAVLTLALPLALLADNYCKPSAFKSFSKSECAQRVEKVVNSYRDKYPYKSNKAFAYVVHSKKDSHVHHLDAMLAALELKKKTVNGYSSSCNRFYGPFWTNVDSLSLKGWLNNMSYPIDSIDIIHNDK